MHLSIIGRDRKAQELLNKFYKQWIYASGVLNSILYCLLKPTENIEDKKCDAIANVYTKSIIPELTISVIINTVEIS